MEKQRKQHIIMLLSSGSKILSNSKNARRKNSTGWSDRIGYDNIWLQLNRVKKSKSTAINKSSCTKYWAHIEIYHKISKFSSIGNLHLDLHWSRYEADIVLVLKDKSKDKSWHCLWLWRFTKFWIIPILQSQTTHITFVHRRRVEGCALEAGVTESVPEWTF